MEPHSQLDELAALVDLLVDCADDRTRDRVLIEALESLGWTQAAALYRRAPEGRDAPASGWFEVLARGPADLLPSAGQVEAMALGELPRELPLGRHVFLSGRGADATALALGGVTCEEPELDLVEALFEVLVSVRGGSEAPAPSLLHLIEAPLPAAPEDENGCPEAHELRNLLTSINTVQSLLAGDLGQLDEGESARYEDIFRVECERAADLVGDALSGTRALADTDNCWPNSEIGAWTRRERGRKARQGIEVESLCALALEGRSIAMAAGEFRRGLTLLTENAAAAIRATPSGRGRVQILWTPQREDQALLVVEDDGCAAPGEDLEQLTHDLAGLGWQVSELHRGPAGLRVEAGFELG